MITCFALWPARTWQPLWFHPQSDPRTLRPLSPSPLRPLASDRTKAAQFPEAMANLIAEAVQQGITASMQMRAQSGVSDYPSSQVSQELTGKQDPHHGLDFQAASPSQGSVMGEDNLRDLDLSDDEDLVPDQPSFMGLFRPQLFRSLLHKAKATTRLGVPHPSTEPTSAEAESSLPLFSELAIEMEEVPATSFWLM